MKGLQMAKPETSEKAEKVTITLPALILEGIDQVADSWFTSRSAALTRIYLEWKQANRPQLPTPETVEPAEVTR
jgi:hypothetical protein